LEPTPQEYITKLCNVFDEVKRVLKPTGTCWVNLGDVYGGKTGSPNAPKLSPERMREYKSASHVKERMPAKSLCLIPSRFAVEMTNRGWLLRNEIIWHKPNCMPSSAKDRFTVDFEKLFLFAKSPHYYFERQREGTKRSKIFNIRVRDVAKNRIKHTDREASAAEVSAYREGHITIVGRNVRSVWSINSQRFKGAHFATYPEELCERPIKAGCPVGGIVLDIFAGAGTSLLVAKKLGRRYVGIELSPTYCRISEARLKETAPIEESVSTMQKSGSGKAVHLPAEEPESLAA
jgi:site-specific DNA-methyltransferase (adenine-specific)